MLDSKLLQKAFMPGTAAPMFVFDVCIMRQIMFPLPKPHALARISGKTLLKKIGDRPWGHKAPGLAPDFVALDLASWCSRMCVVAGGPCKKDPDSAVESMTLQGIHCCQEVIFIVWHKGHYNWQHCTEVKPAIFRGIMFGNLFASSGNADKCWERWC